MQNGVNMLSGISEEVDLTISKNRNQKRHTLIEVNNLFQLAITALADIPKESLIFKGPYDEKWAMYFHRTVNPFLSAANYEEFDALLNRVNKSILKMKSKGKLEELHIQHIWAHFVKDCIQNGNILKEGDAETGASWTILADQLRQLRSNYPDQFVGLKDYDRFEKDKTYQRDEEITKKIQQIFLAFMGQLEKNGATAQVQAFHNFLHIVTVACSNEDNICSYLATNINCCLLIGLRLDYHLCQIEKSEITEELIHLIPRVEYDFMACFTYAILQLDLFKKPYNGAMYRPWQQDSILFNELSSKTILHMWNSPASPLCKDNSHLIRKKSSIRSFLSHFKLLSIDSETKSIEPTPEKEKSPRRISPRKKEEVAKITTHDDKPKNLRARLKRKPLSETDLHQVNPKMYSFASVDGREKEATQELPKPKPKPPLSDFFMNSSDRNIREHQKPVLPNLSLSFQETTNLPEAPISPRKENDGQRNFLPLHRGRIRSPRGESPVQRIIEEIHASAVDYQNKKENGEKNEKTKRKQSN
jgi:hypothetical protein